MVAHRHGPGLFSPSVRLNTWLWTVITTATASLVTDNVAHSRHKFQCWCLNVQKASPCGGGPPKPGLCPGHRWGSSFLHTLAHLLTIISRNINEGISGIFTGSTAQSATCLYLIYSEANFEVFHHLLYAKFHPNWCDDKGVGPQKLKFLLRFDQNVEYKCPAGAYPLCDFHKICRVCTAFQDTLGVKKIRLDLLQGLWSYGGWGGLVSPNFQHP